MKLSSPSSSFVSNNMLLLIFGLLHVFLLPQLGSSYDPIGHSCDGGSVPPQANVNRVLAQLVSEAPKNNFTTASYRGSGGDSAVFGLLQCRGDVPSSVCAQCAQDAVSQAKSLCGTQPTKVWFDFCYLRYDTSDFFRKLDTGCSVVDVNGDGLPNAKLFRKKEENLLRKVSSMAAATGGRAIGTAQTAYNSTVTIYGLAQCRRDLDPVFCAKCLATSISNFPSCCDGRQGAQVSYDSCVARYEIYPFYYPFIGNTNPASISTTAHLHSGRIARYNP